MLPYRVWLLIAFVVALGLSAINVPHPDDFMWEHILTALALAALVWLEFSPRGALTSFSYTLIFVYMLLHVLGARYTYSQVPYDQWSVAVFGARISDLIGAASYQEGAEAMPRNHYDRLVHFAFGLLLLRPASELAMRWLNPVQSPRPTDQKKLTWRAVVVAAGFLCVLGTLYELLEWIYAEVVGAEAAELYNGQQGDMFDGQKDLALNIAGSVLAGLIMAMAALVRWSRRP